MASTLSELVLKGGNIYFDGSPSKATKDKFAIIGSRYGTLAGFKRASIDTFNTFTTEDGAPCFRALTQKERSALEALKSMIDPNISVEENFIKLLTRDFIQRQALAISNLTLEGLNANPLLCKALKLNTPEEFVKFYAYSAISRSIVTSMGFLVQDLMLYSNTNVFDGKNYPTTYGTKWDVVIEKLNGTKSYIEVKSGPNDLDKTQILAYDKAINLVLQHGEEAYLGITYGKKDGKYVSTSILETYVANWRGKTLIGAELWDYISDNREYHSVLMNTIHETAESYLGDTRLVQSIDDKITDLVQDFYRQYGNMNVFYNSLW